MKMVLALLDRQDDCGSVTARLFQEATDALSTR
jgi:hypothetical protein